MLYETLNHPYLFIIFFVCGVLGGFVFDAGNFIKFLCGNKKIPKIVITFLETSLCLVLLFIFNLKFNYGVIRLFPYVIFFVVFCFYRFTIGKLFAKIYLSCYNYFIKAKNFIWGKFTNDKTNKTN